MSEHDDIHTCHDACQRPGCVARRERDEARAELAKAREEIERLLGLLVEATGLLRRVVLNPRAPVERLLWRSERIVRRVARDAMIDKLGGGK